jgi:hypothetical protein
MLVASADRPVRAFIVWEPVLLTDWTSPSTTTLARITDPAATQFWDRRRLLSHLLGEHSRSTIVWDHIAIYPPTAIWNDRPPIPLYQGSPVVKVADTARQVLTFLRSPTLRPATP